MGSQRSTSGSQGTSSREAVHLQHVRAVQEAFSHERDRQDRARVIVGDATRARNEFFISERTSPSPAAEAAWKGRMESMHAETLALKAIGGKRLGSTASICSAASACRLISPRTYSIRHVATDCGLRCGKVAPGACPLPPTETDQSLGSVEEAIQGRLYWRYLEYVSARLLHDRAF